MQKINKTEKLILTTVAKSLPQSSFIPESKQHPISSRSIDYQSNSSSLPFGTVLDPENSEHVKKITHEHKTIEDFKSTANGLVRILKTDATGLAVVANKDIKAGTRICSFRGEKQWQTEDQLRSQSLDVQHYSFELEHVGHKSLMLFAHKTASEASLINCSYDGYDNIKVELLEGEVTLCATRDIQAGEEILLNYGEKYYGSENFLHVFPIGSRSIENFLQQNNENYSQTPVKLTLHEQQLLNTTATHVLVPKDYFQHKDAWKNYDINKINLLPIIELLDKPGEGFKPLKDQQFITPLMYACLRKDYDIVEYLKKSANVRFVTKKNSSALSILTENYHASAGVKKLCHDLAREIKHIYRKNKWLKFYPKYITDNAKHASAIDIKLIISSTKKKKNKRYAWENKRRKIKKMQKNNVNPEPKLAEPNNSYRDEATQLLQHTQPAIVTASTRPIEEIKSPIHKKQAVLAPIPAENLYFGIPVMSSDKEPDSITSVILDVGVVPNTKKRKKKSEIQTKKVKAKQKTCSHNYTEQSDTIIRQIFSPPPSHAEVLPVKPTQFTAQTEAVESDLLLPIAPAPFDFAGTILHQSNLSLQAPECSPYMHAYSPSLFNFTSSSSVFQQPNLLAPHAFPPSTWSSQSFSSCPSFPSTAGQPQYSSMAGSFPYPTLDDRLATIPTLSACSTSGLHDSTVSSTTQLPPKTHLSSKRELILPKDITSEQAVEVAKNLPSGSILRFDPKTPKHIILRAGLYLPDDCSLDVNSSASSTCIKSLEKILSPGCKLISGPPKSSSTKRMSAPRKPKPKPKRKVITSSSAQVSKSVSEPCSFLPPAPILSSYSESDFLKAIKDGDYDVVMNLCHRLKGDNKINKIYSEGDTALHIAILALIEASNSESNLNPRIEIIRRLVYLKGGDINTTIRNFSHKTALELLMENGRHLGCYDVILTILVNSERRHLQTKCQEIYKNSQNPPTSQIMESTIDPVKFRPVAKGIMGNNKSQFLSGSSSYKMERNKHKQRVEASQATTVIDDSSYLCRLD